MVWQVSKVRDRENPILRGGDGQTHPLRAVAVASPTSGGGFVWTVLGSGIAFDREVCYPMANDRPWRLPEQSEAPIEGLTTAGAEHFIASRNPDTSNPQAGWVNMAAYAAWLRANYGIDLPH